MLSVLVWYYQWYNDTASCMFGQDQTNKQNTIVCLGISKYFQPAMDPPRRCGTMVEGKLTDKVTPGGNLAAKLIGEQFERSRSKSTSSTESVLSNNESRALTTSNTIPSCTHSLEYDDQKSDSVVSELIYDREGANCRDPGDYFVGSASQIPVPSSARRTRSRKRQVSACMRCCEPRNEKKSDVCEWKREETFVVLVDENVVAWRML
jgi:hypothetical protein